MTSIDRLRVADCDAMREMGLSPGMIAQAITFTHEIVDTFDAALKAKDEEPLSAFIELANLSSVIGNLFRIGITRASKGKLQPNGPHKFPDLVSSHSSSKDIEIKVALDGNSPKGHLVKAGAYLTLRYVLCDANGWFTLGTRGKVPRIWEVRVGNLAGGHFNSSSTKGDSGKTAPVNAAGMDVLTPVFLDVTRCPLPPGGPRFRKLFPRCHRGCKTTKGYAGQMTSCLSCLNATDRL